MSRLFEALARIDAFNDGDPRRAGDVGQEVVYGRRMSAVLARLCPDASEELQIAARAQHIGRWRIPRADYPEGRAGYRRWRADLARLHADTAAELLTELGYGEARIARVRALLRKENLARDPEVQALEDCACLVFFEHHFADFSEGRGDDDLARIAQKTWAKMSPAARRAAAALPLPERLARIVARAAAGP